MLNAVIVSVVLGLRAGSAGEPIPVLLVTGQNNHDWRYTSAEHQKTLEATGRFHVELITDPASALRDTKALAGYKAIMLDYNGPRWGADAETNFVSAVENGAGVVVIHAANNAFPGWAEYEQMVGLLWRDGAGHGKFHAFDIRVADHDHPVMRGLPDFRAHPDELYHGLTSPQGATFQVLATAYSSPESGGTGNDEPMVIAGRYGRGRVFHTTLGHVWTGKEETRASIADPQFKVLLARGTEWAATGEVTLPATWRPEDPATKDGSKSMHNTLTDAERADGWELLFDGRAPIGLRGYKAETFPAQGWVVDGDALRHAAGQGGGDIVTKEEYADFEFSCEWKVAPQANSGIMYRVSEDHGATYETGPEYQVLDNEGHRDGLDPRTAAGALYGLIACGQNVLRPVGEFNEARVVARGNHVEHWLNGVKVVEYELHSAEWKALIEASKFREMPDFGRNVKGHIALQDHGDDVWYRNIKVKKLEGK